MPLLAEHAGKALELFFHGQRLFGLAGQVGQALHQLCRALRRDLPAQVRQSHGQHHHQFSLGDVGFGAGYGDFRARIGVEGVFLPYLACNGGAHHIAYRHHPCSPALGFAQGGQGVGRLAAL